MNENNNITENNNNGYIDPKMYNKFKNDGSFLQEVLAMQKKKKTRKVNEDEENNSKKKKLRNKENLDDNDKGKINTLDGNVEDEREKEIKNEYIEQINKMKEQGLFTDKGIGAGLVK
ncbi:conserved Plasmodium protein, unknown function [Plasmodium sp. gorilla clade G2]|uniref:conserved Plasmodium protein, unknown function n=1 Tax=Plasmodium sp. gorilla clade G2 TaxID=880535 RepID=UPI000D22BB0A|nr:conserved Plasmodium protein, unknown function [Plasmodium sp. gorilla clade G2]SOV11612.1 conserved Plasmodium protein, unknown function [Plasmodium sp. gorilla clade G2]